MCDKLHEFLGLVGRAIMQTILPFITSGEREYLKMAIFECM